MQGKEHVIFIDFLVINSVDVSPDNCSAFCCGKVLNSMEGKCSKVSDFAAHFSVTSCTKCMCCIRYDCNSSQSLLDFIVRWSEERFFLFDNLENSVIVTDNTSNINRNHCLCLFGNCCFQCIVVHLIAVFLTIDQYQFCSNMADNACRCGIGVRTGDNLIPRTYP